MPGILGRRDQRQRRRRRARLQRRLQEDLLGQMIRRRYYEAVTLHRLANAMGVDVETIRVGGVGFGGVPASAAAVADLEKQTFRATTEGCGGGGNECAICLEGFEDGEEVSVMPCSHGHRFHPVCIIKWLGRSNMCPLCRHQLPTDVIIDEEEERAFLN